MKKLLAMALAALLCPLAGAWQVEGGVGYSHTTPQPNGTWYQEGFPYKLDLNKASWYVGVKDKIDEDKVLHINYVSFGIIHADAIATTDDNYNATTHSCNGKCVAQSHFVGSGRSDGLKIAVEKLNGNWGFIGGGFLFKPRWHTTVYDWTLAYDMPPRTIEHSIKQNWTLRPMVGVAYHVDSWEVKLEHYFNKPYDSTNTGLTHGTTMLSLGYSF